MSKVECGNPLIKVGDPSLLAAIFPLLAEADDSGDSFNLIRSSLIFQATACSIGTVRSCPHARQRTVRSAPFGDQLR